MTTFSLMHFAAKSVCFFVLLGRVSLVLEGVELFTWRIFGVRESSELQNGGLRALEEVWDDLFV